MLKMLLLICQQGALLASNCWTACRSSRPAVFSGSVQRDYQVDSASHINTLFAGNLCFLSDLGIRFYCCDTSLTLLLFWQQQNNVLLLISWAAPYLWLRFYSIDFEAVIFVFYNQENLIQCTEPDSVQVSTKDMDSTLSKASRAIKKTSKKVKMSPSSISCPRMELWQPWAKQKWAMESYPLILSSVKEKEKNSASHLLLSASRQQSSRGHCASSPPQDVQALMRATIQIFYARLH